MDTSTSRTSGSLTPAAEKLSTSKKLISDLVWLERKIAQNHAAEYAETLSPTSTDLTGPRPVNDPSESLSFTSGGDGTNGLTHSASQDSSLATGPMPPTYRPSIVCRDCFAPPGKLRIVIHSTKDGPAVHTVKPGSSLEGHIFPGDLIISVDDADTRSFSAEQVMKLMTAKSRSERKITVLHFDQELPRTATTPRSILTPNSQK